MKLSRVYEEKERKTKMKRLKKMIAFIVAAVMILGTMNMAFADPTEGGTTPDTSSTIGDLTSDAQITILGLAVGDVVHLYQVLKWTDGEGWTIADGFEALVTEGDSNYCQKVQDLIDNKPGTTLAKEDIEKIANVAKASSPTDLGGSVAEGEDSFIYSTTADPGMYIALVTPGAAGVVYNPIIVSADFSATPQTSEIDASTAVMGSSAVAKKEIITVTKEVEDAETAQASDNTHNVGDIVKFTITGLVPAYSDSYVNPTYKITDTLTEGLELVIDESHEFKVESADDLVHVDTQSDDYVEPVNEGTGFTLPFISSEIAALVDYNTVTITYYAKITSEAETNVTEEENTVTVEFSNNPQEDGDAGIIKDKTKHYTFTIDGNMLGKTSWKNSEIVKVGVEADGETPIESTTELSNGTEIAALQGATFGLYKNRDDAENATAGNPGNLYTNELFDGTVVSGADGRMTINGLDAGTYYLKELDAPNGYIRDTTIYEITIEANIEPETVRETIEGRVVTYDVPVLKDYTITVTPPGNASKFTTTISGSQVLESVSGTDITTSAKNVKGVELPATGGIGTTIFYVIGSVLVLGAGILLVTRRRMNGN